MAGISANSTSPKTRGWFSTGKKATVSKSPIHTPEDDEVYSTGPARQMKQVRKSKSEKGKMKIYASAQELGHRNTKWHISLPNIHDTREVTSQNLSRNPNSTSPLPPPPSNPPPILHSPNSDTHTSRPRVRELFKSVSAGAINVVNPMRVPARLLSPQGSPPVKQAKETERKTLEENGKQRRAPPPMLPPPCSAKTRAATVISAAIQEHVQSSTRSAPGNLQNTTEGDQSPKPTEKETTPGSNSRLKSESAEKAKEIQRPQPPKRPEFTPQSSNDEESPLTASIEGGVKSLARYFSTRSKESLTTQSPPPKHSPKVIRQAKGRQILKRRLKKVSSIPETHEEENESVQAEGQNKQLRLPPILSISNDPDTKYEVLHNVSSIASPGSPTHMSLFSWYNPGPDSKFDASAAEKKRYQNVFDDDSFPCFDKTGTRNKSESSSASPKSPTYREYQNVQVETVTLVGETPDVPSSREGSHKEKKPVPLPRTQSKERGIGIPKVRERHLATSDSDGALSVPSPQSSITNRISDYIDMSGGQKPQGKTAEGDSHEARVSPDMVVLGSLDPEWRYNFEELIEREIEMTEGFSDTDEEAEESQVYNGDEGVPRRNKEPIAVPPPFVPVKKAALKKTQSHNPNRPNIQRRNTPKEKRELRKGVCSEIDHLEQDEYIPMQSTSHANNTPLPSQGNPQAHHPEMASSLTVPKPPPGLDPRSSTYYLKILPSPMVRPPEENITAEASTPAKHFYIEIDVPDDPSEDRLTQAEQEGLTDKTLPPKSSPVHMPSSAPVVEAKRKRKLKYPKISVGTAASNAAVFDDDKVRKTPYSRVKVDGQSESASDTNSHPVVGRQRSQGSIFSKEMLSYVHRPLPPTPSEGAVYYKTVNHPLGNIPSMRHVWHHEYTEIDESELNQKNREAASRPAEGWINIHAAGGPVRVQGTKQRSLTTLDPPPPVPQRPSCPYVEIDGEDMEKLAASLPLARHARLTVGPKVAKKLGPPPEVPGRPEETFRQRSFSSSGEYSYPVIPGLMFEWLNMKKGGVGDKAYFTPRGPLSSISRPSRHPASNGKKSLMETIEEKGFTSDSPPTVPPKTESLLREQMGLLANRPTRRPSPYLVPVTSVKKESSYDHLTSEATPPPQQNRPKSPKEVVSNLRKELFGEDRSEHEEGRPPDKVKALPHHLIEKKKAMAPPSPPLPYQTSVEAKEKVPPKVPKKKKKVSRDNGTSGHTHSGTEDERPSSADTKRSPPDSVALRKARLQDRIDRNSLAMIMRNKSAIEEKLEKESDSPKSRRKLMPKERGEVSVVRSLGDILLDVDALLQRRMCSEDDLIAAIENQLNIKLEKRKPNDTSRGEERRADTEETLVDSVQVTEQDVKEVVSFMNNSQASPSGAQQESKEEEGWAERSVIVKDREEEEEEGSSEHEGLGSPKRRSSTVIVADDPAVPPATAKRDSDSNFPTDQAARMLEDEEGETDEKQMRDSRSSSVGLKPLRRVKARRRTNPASDMANLSVATNHFTQGTGVFTSRGGTLTNLTSEVEIEVPRGAVPPGKRQKLWFEVIQKIYDPPEENKEISFQELSQNELSDSNSSVDEVGSVQSERRKRVIQLSTMVLIGPSDAQFEQPIKIKMPHCLPYRNNSWHLHLQARAHNCESDDWLELSNSSGLIIPQSRQRQRFFKNSTYQMHLHYAVVRTREMGSFKLCGSPMRNGSHSAKRMVASIFAKQDGGKTWLVFVTLSNAIHDQIQALDLIQRKAGYTSLEHSVPVLCFGEGKDMELSLCAESNSLPLATQVIPFGKFWRLERVGQARATFSVSLDQVESSESKTLTLKIQQAGSQLLHETNFVLAE